MAAITASMVAELRKKTGLGMMDCKKALVESEGDVDKAIKILREKGLATAAKKESRIAAEGVVDILATGDIAAVIEVNSETDFVAKNESFREFVKGLLRTIVANKPADVEALKALNFDGTSATVDAALTEKIAQIGEKLSIRRFAIVEGTTATYIHGMGTTGVIVKFEADEAVAAKPEFAEFAKNICLQIAAGTPPTYVNREDVPASVLAEEKEILMAQIKNDEKNANKPEQIIAKMVEGRIGKFYEKACLVDQLYVKGDSLTIAKYVAAIAMELGVSIKIDRFVPYEKGEGLEKREVEFAVEIAKLTGKA
jgi:elongation factor Ts